MAFLQIDGERHAVLLLDLSAGGAKLNCPATLSTGTAVVLDCGTLCRSALVRWQTGGVLGSRRLEALAIHLHAPSWDSALGSSHNATPAMA